MYDYQLPTISEMLRHFIFIPSPIDTRRPKRRITGVKYPHSSTRQRARYARQIATGQIRNA